MSAVGTEGQIGNLNMVYHFCNYSSGCKRDPWVLCFSARRVQMLCSAFLAQTTTEYLEFKSESQWQDRRSLYGSCFSFLSLANFSWFWLLLIIKKELVSIRQKKSSLPVTSSLYVPTHISRIKRKPIQEEIPNLFKESYFCSLLLLESPHA